MSTRKLLIVVLIVVFLTICFCQDGETKKNKNNKQKNNNKNKNNKNKNNQNDRTGKGKTNVRLNELESNLAILKEQMQNISDCCSEEVIYSEEKVETLTTPMPPPQSQQTGSCQSGMVTIVLGMYGKFKREPIEFDPPFAKPPNLLYAITMMSVADTPVEVEADAVQITEKSAQLQFRTRTRCDRAKIRWMACP